MKFISYWRDSMADSLLPSYNARKEDPEISWENFKSGQMNPKLAEKLVLQYRRLVKNSNNYKKSKSDTPRAHSKELEEDINQAPLLISPLVFSPEYRHGMAYYAQKKRYMPLIVPARVNIEGKLASCLEAIPWIARESLEPSASQSPVMNTLEAFDDFRAKNPEYTGAEWEDLISYLESLIQALTDSSMEQFVPAKFVRHDIALMQLEKTPFSPIDSIVKLADFLLDTEKPSLGALSHLFHKNNGKPIAQSQVEKLKLSRQHVGQMGENYPLADRQRDALNHLILCKTGDILAVNGPPGTGKTALLQSVISNLYVTAALKRGAPPVIFASSNNNQAVTNIIDSFGTTQGDHQNEDPLKKRWIPGLTSYALSIPSKSQKKHQEHKYQVTTLSNAEDEAFLTNLMSSEAVARAEQNFLKLAGEVLDYKDLTIEKARDALSVDLTVQHKKLSEILKAAIDVLSMRSESTNHTSNNKKEAELTLSKSIKILEQFEENQSLALEALEHQGTLEFLFSWLPSIRAKRWNRCRKIMRASCFKEGPFQFLKVPTEEAIRHTLDQYICCLQKDFTENKALVATEAQKEKIEKRWRRAEKDWKHIASTLINGAPKGLKKMLPSEQVLIAHPEQCNLILDVTLRHKMFCLATHYWEARWIIEAQDFLKGLSPLHLPVAELFRKTREKREYCFRFLAHLMPCFVSTLYMLPRHLTYYDPNKTFGNNKNPPLLDVVDLLIVDEAGQVSTEIGAMPLVLGKKALIVGDIHQIEPTWNIPPRIDDANLSTRKFIAVKEKMDEAGMLAQNGSLMKLARSTSAFKQNEEAGIFLEEHRRCQTPIIQISNELSYKGQLKPCTPLLKNPLFPPLGWAHIRSTSSTERSSRYNSGEAVSIAEWIKRNQKKIEGKYGPIEDVVGIITPFRAQTSAIKDALKNQGISNEITVGTVHSFQGAEREIIIFSPTCTLLDKVATPFFDWRPNMLNVAASRAKHSFFLFGDMRLFDPTKLSLPSGIVAKHTFGTDGHEIADVISRPEFYSADASNQIINRIDSLEAHQSLLKEAILSAQNKVLVVSPYISHRAIEADNLAATIRQAVARSGVSISIVYDPVKNQELDGSIKETTALGLSILQQAGAQVFGRKKLHNKTLAVDNKWIVEGSFNWLSAIRQAEHAYASQERSLRYDGYKAPEYCTNAWQELDLGDKHKQTLTPPPGIPVSL